MAALIRGSGLDALACSLRLSQLAIHHYWSPTREPGGHFRGFTVSCSQLKLSDLGMVLLEPGTSESETSSFESYLGEQGTESKKFFSSLMSWLEAGTGFVLENHPVYTIFRGRRFEDYFIGDSLAVLSSLNPHELRTIRHELTTIAAAGHAITATTRAVEDASLGAALDRSLGSTLANVMFGSYLEAFPGVRKIPLQLHRQVWIPMYWTQSVAEKITSGLQPFSEAQFSAPKGFNVAQLVRTMADKALSSPYRHVVNPREKPGSVLDFPARSVKRVLNIEFALVHFCVAGDIKRSTFFLADTPRGVTRITLSPSGPTEPGTTAPSLLASVEIPLRNSTRTNEELREAAKAAIREVGGRPLCGGVVKRVPFGYGASADGPSDLGGSSLNDNLLRGLGAAGGIRL